MTAIATIPAERQWMMRDGQIVDISTLRDSHLLNIDRMLRARDAHNPAVEAEIERRGLDPLPDATPVEQECRDAMTTLRAQWRHLDLDQRRALHRNVAAWLREMGLPVAADYVEAPL